MFTGSATNALAMPMAGASVKVSEVVSAKPPSPLSPAGSLPLSDTSLKVLPLGLVPEMVTLLSYGPKLSAGVMIIDRSTIAVPFAANV